MLKRRTVPLVALAVGLAFSAPAQEAASNKETPPLAATQATTTQPPRGAPNFGTTTTVYYRLSPADFNQVRYGSSFGANDWVLLWTPMTTPQGGFAYTFLSYPVTSGIFTGARTLATPHLPGGALVTYLELDYCDTNVSGEHVVVNLFNCDYHGTCDSTPLTTLTSVSGACSQVNTSSLSYTMDNYLKEFLVDVSFAATDGSNQLAGVILGYTLQVSPDPVYATFNDVPFGHPQHQFVEALVAAGITAGCGGGNYCPTNPLTRGQMAVFLAKALGLNWSQ